MRLGMMRHLRLSMQPSMNGLLTIEGGWAL
jgi:hypothetical protein